MYGVIVLQPRLFCLASLIPQYEIQQKSAQAQLVQHCLRVAAFRHWMSKFDTFTATYSTRSSSLPLLTVPNPSTVFARRAFNYTAPTTWNSLPADILTCDSESGFKRLLKTHLFNNCFNVAWLTHSQRLCSSAYGALQICLWYDDMIWKHILYRNLFIFEQRCLC